MLDIWQLDKFKEIMISNAGSTPLHADLHLGEVEDWDDAYAIAQPLADTLGYTIIEHDIYEDDPDDFED